MPERTSFTTPRGESGDMKALEAEVNERVHLYGMKREEIALIEEAA